MRSVQLGRTGVRVTEFFFGAGAIGGIGSAASTRGKGLTEVEGLARLDEAGERGIRVIDTANSYAGGESERVIGRWVETGTHDDVLITTKVGNIAEPGQTELDVSHDAIIRNAKRSRERLSRFELYMLHGLDGRTPLEESIATMTELVDETTIHAWGVCNVDEEQLEALLETALRLGVRGPGWVQNEFSLLSRDDAVQALCAAQGLGYTGYSPLAGGLLSDRYLDGRDPQPGSRLDVAGAIYPERTPEVLDRVRALSRLAQREGMSTASLALWWLRWHPSVTASIVSPRSSAQWADVDASLDRDDDAALRAEIDAIFPRDRH